MYTLRFKLLTACMSINQSIFCPYQKRQKDLLKSFVKKRRLNNAQEFHMRSCSTKFFLDQLNSLQILEPLHLAREHLPSDIIDILERLRKADNIPFNQLYYIAKNCADRYYSKLIKTFVFLIKKQFVDRQTLLVNTACSL